MDSKRPRGPMTLEEMRADYRRSRMVVPSLPIAGCINYSVAAALTLAVVPERANLVLLCCFWAIMPVAALIGRLRRAERSGDPGNDLFRLSALMRWMVLATWAIHVPVWLYAPALFPLTIGIAFGLHWMIFGWMLDRPIGIHHLALRTVLVLAAWCLVPSNRVGAVSLAVAIAYGFSVWQLSRMGRAERLAHGELREDGAYRRPAADRLEHNGLS